MPNKRLQCDVRFDSGWSEGATHYLQIWLTGLDHEDQTPVEFRKMKYCLPYFRLLDSPTTTQLRPVAAASAGLGYAEQFGQVLVAVPSARTHRRSPPFDVRVPTIEGDGAEQS